MLKKGILSDKVLGCFFILVAAFFASAVFCNTAYAANVSANDVVSTPVPASSDEARSNFGANYNATMPSMLGDQFKVGPLVAGVSNSTTPAVMDSTGQGVLSKEEERLVMDIKYPITSNKLIDLELFTWATGQMQTFVSAVRGFKEDDGNATFEYSLNIDYKTFQTADTFSVLFHTSTYTGGAHPANGQISFVFKLDDARRLRLADIFQSDDKSIATLLSSLCYATLKDDLGKLGFEVSEDAIPPELDSFSAFAIDKAGLIIFFEPYQVAPYSFGYQTVSIPLKDLGPLKPRMELW